MSLFGTILDKLGLKKKPAQQPAPAKPAPSGPPKPAESRSAPPQTRPPQASGSTAASKPAGQSKPVGTPPRPGGIPSPASKPELRSNPAAPYKPETEPMEMVDVMGKLERMAAENPQQLNWKTSIVDLLKLLDMDSSLEARRELATELDIPQEKMSDSATMNMWLHKTVLQKLAENGGNIPRELLD